MRPLIVVLSILLSSCALYPTVPRQTPEELARIGTADPYTYFDVENTRNMVRGLRITLEDSAADRRTADTVLREISFYGTLVLVGGTLEESIAARNIGGGSAGLASIFSNHYGIKVQRSAFTRAARHARCLEDAIRPIAPEVRILFDSSFDGNEDLAQKYYAIPTVTFDEVNKIRVNLAAELDGIAMGAPSVNEIKSIFDDLSQATEQATNQAKATTVGPQDVVRIQQMFPMAAPGVPLADCNATQELSEDLKDLCDAREILSLPTWEQEDRKKQFVLAVGTYANVVTACSVTKQ